MIGVDPDCFVLADHFLADLPPWVGEQVEAVRLSLAEHIQRSIDDWFEAQNWEPFR